jgi:hypothetical protein
MPFLHHKPERSPKPRFDDRPTYTLLVCMACLTGLGLCVLLAMIFN